MHRHSWEVFFGNRAIDGIDMAHVILNPTNGSSYTGTILQSRRIAYVFAQSRTGAGS